MGYTSKSVKNKVYNVVHAFKGSQYVAYVIVSAINTIIGIQQFMVIKTKTQLESVYEMLVSKVALPSTILDQH